MTTIRTFICTALLIATSSSYTYANTPRSVQHTDSVYLLTYATNNPKEGIHLAYSADQKRWTAIGNDYSVVKSDFGNWGPNKNMYHPSVVYTDGEWYAAWTVNSRAHQFATTHSSDLWLWKPQDYPYTQAKQPVQNLVLTHADNVFTLYLQTDKGYYSTTSRDFRTWENETPVTEAVYKAQQRSQNVFVNGVRQNGEIHRVPYSVVEQLKLRISDAENRNRSYSESTRDDERRFRGIQSLHATLDIHPDDTKAISPNLIGIFFEDINYSADGGLYAELIQNRDFEYNALDRKEWNAKSFWKLVGNGTTFDIDTIQPIHANNAHYAVLTTSTPGASLRNEGFDGITLHKGDKYDISLFAKSMDKTPQRLVVKLLDGQQVIAQTTLSIPASGEWKQHTAVLRPDASAKAATLSVEPLTAGTLAIDFVSLFPQKTFKGRKNGLRADLAQTLADLRPRFVRFPGGCVTHGNGIDNMYHWRTTIGPLWERQSQSNIWGYHQSKGLGFYEYFQFCEDIGAEPLPVLPAGVPCQNSSRDGWGQQGGIPMEQMDAYAQELLDLIEWANGNPATSPLARLRAQAGHPAPFHLKYLGIGNEDLISDVFTERFNYLHRIIKQAHPDIQIVGTAGPFFEGSDYEYGWQLARQENVDLVDEHYYVAPGWYFNNQNFYDTYPRTGPKVYLGEWASKGNRLENALAEAMHLTNIERNADVVTMTSYAPLLAKDGHTQWNPDLIYFNNTEVRPTVNYQVQKLYGNNTGTLYLASDLVVEAHNDTTTFHHADATRRISHSVVRDEATGDLIVKLVNVTPLSTTTTITLPDAAAYAPTAIVSTLSGQPADRDNRPTETTLTIADTFTHTLPAYSFSVIRIHAKTAQKRR